jgi:hypothetical protein
MDAADALQTWQTAQDRDRPAVVRNHRDGLMAHLDVSEAIPTDSLASVRDWMDRYAGTVTTQLTDAAEGGDSDES